MRRSSFVEVYDRDNDLIIPSDSDEDKESIIDLEISERVLAGDANSRRGSDIRPDFGLEGESDVVGHSSLQP